MADGAETRSLVSHRWSLVRAFSRATTDKRRATLFCLLLSAFSLPAQSTAPAQPLGHAPAEPLPLERIIGELQAKYSRLKNLAADFVQIYRAPGTRLMREEGTVVLSKHRKMRWNYTHPEEKLFISDGQSVYLYVPSQHQVRRAKIKEHEDIKASFAFFLGELNLRRLFSLIELARDERPVEAGNYVLRFMPRQPQSGFSELIIEVSPSNWQLKRVSIRELDGAQSDFLFSNVRENVAISPSSFVFSIPPGVQVLDVR